MRISSHVDVYGSSEDDYRLFIENLLLTSGRHICAPQRDTNMASRHSLINLSTTFLRISPARNIAQTWIFATLFEYSSSFSSLILDFICWMVLMVVWQWKPSINHDQTWRQKSHEMFARKLLKNSVAAMTQLIVFPNSWSVVLIFFLKWPQKAVDRYI